MELLKTIGEYCQLYRVTMPNCDLSEFNGFVAIDSTEARVLRYQQTKLLGQVICAAMKRGAVFYVNNGVIVALHWDMWKGFWNRHFAPKAPKSNLPEPHYVPRKKRSMFEEGKGERSRKKAKSGGFQVTHNSNINLHRMGSYIPTRPLA